MMGTHDPVIILIGGLVGTFGLYAFIALIVQFVNHKKMKRKNSNSSRANAVETRDPEEYADTVMYLSATTAERMRKEHGLTDNQSSEIMAQIVGFCIINLMRKLDSESIPKPKGQKLIDSILRKIAERVGGNEHEESAYITYGNMIGDLSRRFGDLPLSNPNSGKQGGTLLWEYAKHMNDTMGKDTLDLEMLMRNVSVITDINKKVDTSKLIETLRSHGQ